MRIDESDSRPVYVQIADHIRRAIAAGKYRPGEMVPSLRALALELTVNPNTVQRAYETLERDGLIYSRKGLGMFVTRQGVASAQSTAEDSVRRSFQQGVRFARQARLANRKIRLLFDQVLREAEGQSRRHR